MASGKNYAKLALGLIFVVAIIAFFYFGLDKYLTFDYLKSQQANLASYVTEHFWLSIAIFFVIYVVAAALSIPGAGILTIAGGAIFGLVTGTVVVSFASSIGAYFAFLGARFMFRDAVTRRFGAQLESIEKGIQKDGNFYLLTLRLVPAVPFFIVNLLMGLTSLKGRTFYGISQLGMFPGTVAYFYVGTQLSSIKSLPNSITT